LLIKDTRNAEIDNIATVVMSKYSNGTKSDPTCHPDKPLRTPLPSYSINRLQAMLYANVICLWKCVNIVRKYATCVMRPQAAIYTRSVTPNTTVTLHI
jgi:hypothetical protein